MADALVGFLDPKAGRKLGMKVSTAVAISQRR
jgi:hypothetical protein